MTAKVDLPTVRKAAYAIKRGNKIGEGAYRAVYKTKSGKWVYKVNTGYGTGIGSNGSEYATYVSVKNSVKLPDGVKLPEMHMVGEYIAAEYVDGEHPTNWCSPGPYGFHDNGCPGVDTCWAAKVNDVKINDLHPYNVMVTKDGTVYIIDLGHGEK